MGTAERRYEIMKLLCRRRHETIRNLASEFGVSMRTIQRDIETLSRTEPIYTQFGKYGGGVYIVEGYSLDRMYMNEQELNESQTTDHYIDLNLMPMLTDTQGRLQRSEGFILKAKKKNSGFSVVATGDNYFSPQILEINYR